MIGLLPLSVDPIRNHAGRRRTTFHFVTDGIEAALGAARVAAGNTDVRLGGVATIQQYLKIGRLPTCARNEVGSYRGCAGFQGSPATKAAQADVGIAPPLGIACSPGR
jgi:hypothetical protein